MREIRKILFVALVVTLSACTTTPPSSTELAQTALIIDTHDREVCEGVWQLYEEALLMIEQPVATMIERDENVPALPELLAEMDRAASVLFDVVMPL